MTKEYEYCLRCGRKLRTAETRSIGYGKICLEKMKVKNTTSLFRKVENAKILP